MGLAERFSHRSLFAEKYRMLAWLALLLMAGFLTTSLTAYLVSRDTIRRNITDVALPLTGDNIYSEIQKDILKPVFIASLMASDTFVRDWLLAGERDETAIVRYLAEIKLRYNTITSFLVSDISHRYYYADGVLKTVQAGVPRDDWYFRARNMAEPYVTEVDHDATNREALTIFTNYQVRAYDGRIIGVTGVGVTLDSMSQQIDAYEARFQRTIYFTDSEGRITLAGRSMRDHQALRSMPGLSELADTILNRDATPVRHSYLSSGDTVMVNSRYIPELGWYLLVEQNENEAIRPVRRVFFLGLAVATVVLMLVLGLALFTINRYHARLERMASRDVLTDCLNRQAFEIVFRRLLRDAGRHQRPLSAILFDVDWFKQVNDSHGHLAGDAVLHQLVACVRPLLRDSDVVARWGGEEFMVLLEGCRQPEALRIAEQLRAAIAAHDFGLADARTITVSFGVAEYQIGETETRFFARVDAALYRAKAAGRNRVEGDDADRSDA